MTKRDFYKLLKSGELASMVSESVKSYKLSNSQEVFNIMKPLAAEEPDVESFWIIFMSAKNNKHRKDVQRQHHKCLYISKRDYKGCPA